MYGDPGAVRRLAARVAADADRTRADATRGATATAVHWEGVRATRFRAQLEDGVHQARGAAHELDELAAALLAHAREVEHRLQQIAEAERFLAALANEALDQLHAAEAWAVQTGKDLVNVLSTAAGAVVDGVKDLVGAGESAAETSARAAKAAAERAAEQARAEWERLHRCMDGVPVGDQRWIDLARRHGWTGGW